jgi:hypothetical protein
MSLGWGKHSIPHNQSLEIKENNLDQNTEPVRNQWVERKS